MTADRRRARGGRALPRAACLAAACLIAASVARLPAASLAERLADQKRLAAMRTDARALRRQARPVPRSGRYLDLRCVLHAHSALSHDSRGTAEQIATAAREAGVRAVFMTEHPTADRRWATEGLRGIRDGVLFIPGAELSSGLLLWRGERAAWTPEMSAADALRSLRGTDGVAFVAHPEERRTDADWELPPFHGMEIYNTHADAVDGDEDLLAGLRGGRLSLLLSVLGAVRSYPEEAFAAIFDVPADVLRRWDEQNTRFLPSGRRVVGIAGNDAHQNVGVSLAIEDDHLNVRDALGKSVSRVPARGLPLFLLGLGDGRSVSYTFDPYRVSFGYVSTHLLAAGATEKQLFDALRRGRAYVAFDWMADPTGFRFYAEGGGRETEMGGDARARDRPSLTVRPNMACEIRLLRNGQEVQRAVATELTVDVAEPGVYRAECWVEIAGERRPWIYSNPVYVTGDQ